MEQEDKIKNLILSLRNIQAKDEVTPEMLQQIESMVPAYPVNLGSIDFTNFETADEKFRKEVKAWMDKNAI